MFAALHYPFILAFEPTFIEVRHVDSGNLVQIITGNNIRCLFSDTPPSQIHAANQYRHGMMPPGPYGHPPPPPPHGHYHQPQGGYPYGMHGHPHAPPPPPQQQPVNRMQRSQIIFVSDAGNVQMVRLKRDMGPPMVPNGGASMVRR